MGGHPHTPSHPSPAHRRIHAVRDSVRFFFFFSFSHQRLAGTPTPCSEATGGAGPTAPSCLAAPSRLAAARRTRRGSRTGSKCPRPRTAGARGTLVSRHGARGLLAAGRRALKGGGCSPLGCQTVGPTEAHPTVRREGLSNTAEQTFGKRAQIGKRVGHTFAIKFCLPKNFNAGPQTGCWLCGYCWHAPRALRDVGMRRQRSTTDCCDRTRRRSPACLLAITLTRMSPMRAPVASCARVWALVGAARPMWTCSSFCTTRRRVGQQSRGP